MVTMELNESDRLEIILWITENCPAAVDRASTLLGEIDRLKLELEKPAQVDAARERLIANLVTMMKNRRDAAQNYRDSETDIGAEESLHVAMDFEKEALSAAADLVTYELRKKR